MNATEVINPSKPRLIDAKTANNHMITCNAVLVDVRGFDEFAAGHAKGATCIPLSDIERRVAEIPSDRPVLLICRSGNRSSMAAEKLRSLGMDNVFDVKGGFISWKEAGLPAVHHSNVLPLETQVRITAGMLVFGFSIAGYVVNRRFFYGATAIGFMLIATGLMGICPMMAFLRLLPWNKSTPGCAK